MEKKVKWMTQYSKLFAKAMKKFGRKDYRKLENLFRNRYMDYLCSEEFEVYKKYGSITLERVYAAITHALICLEIGISLEEAKRIWEEMIEQADKKRALFLCKLVDKLKNGYQIVANYLDKEARKHKADESMTFEILKSGDDKSEFKVTSCVYIEIFERYGIREFCKVFCNNIHCLDVLHESARFTRHSNLLDGDCCHLELTKL